MQRFRIPQLLALRTLPVGPELLRKCSNSTLGNSDVLDGILAELDGCETSDRSHPVQRTAPSVGKVTKETLPAQTGSSSKLNAEEARNQRLLRLVKESEIEYAAIAHAQEKASAASDLKSFISSSSAVQYYSSAELTAEKSPQHFVASKNVGDGNTVYSVGGHMSVVSVVGTVVFSGCQKSSGAAAQQANQHQEDPVVSFSVEYDSPVDRHGRCCVRVECRGCSITSFVNESVRNGDVVHLLGELGCSNGTPTVYVLPRGGNVSVIIPKVTPLV